MKIKICFITSSRAEYGLLKPLMQKICERPSEFDFQLIITGTHLLKEFGETKNEIIKDGFKANLELNIFLNDDDSKMGTSNNIGHSILKFNEALNKLKPDYIVILGDRFEILSSAISAFSLDLKIIHLHGGELTFGCKDDTFRHCITKLSHLHFTSTETYRKRVIQLGEEPNRVFNVGAIGLEALANMKILNKIELENDLNIKFKSKNLLIAYHPETHHLQDLEKNLQNLITALGKIEETFLIFTKSNADAGGRQINSVFNDYVQKNKHRSALFNSLGHRRFFSLLSVVDAIVGNSSSAIIEAPSLKTASINIGDRQAGRIQADSVINCDHSVESILKAIQRVYSPEFQKKLLIVNNPYRQANTIDAIISAILKYPIETTNNKRFYDL